MKEDKGASAKASVRSSAAAQPASREMCRRYLAEIDKAWQSLRISCPASRHVRLMGEALARGERYHMIDEEPEECAVSMLATVAALYKLRALADRNDSEDRTEAEGEAHND